MTADSFRAGPGWASAVGSMPGEDPREAAAVVVGELPDLPHLPELPARGPGADLLGRAAAMLVGLHVDLQPSGWRLVDRPGVDERRATSYLRADLDALEEAAEAHVGVIKLQVAGPWTLAAGLRLARGEPVLSDEAAWRDLAASLTEGVVEHVEEVRRRLPRAQLLVQLDEPSLPSVLAGGIRSYSGLRAFEPVSEQVAEAVLRELVDAVRAPTAVHCCAARPPVALLRRAGAAALSLDLTLVGEDADEVLGEVLEAGMVLLAGVVPSSDARLSDPAATVEPVRQLWRRLGLPAGSMAGAVVPTPTCGLAGASPAYVRAALRQCRAAAQVLVDDPEA